MLFRVILHHTRPFFSVAFAFLMALAFSPPAAADGLDATPRLQVTLQGDVLACHLSNIPANSGDRWVLQSSADLDDWEDLLFFDKAGDAVTAIPPGGRERHFLRARHLAADDRVLSEFLDARNTWRGAGKDHYTMEVSWSGSWFFWRGMVTVRNNEVVSAVPIETNYPEAPVQHTIDGWFERLASFFDPRAHSLVVTYDPVLGYPKTAVIDPVLMIADDEENWAILSFQELP